MQNLTLYGAALCAAWMLSGWAPTQVLVTHYDDTRAVQLLVLIMVLLVALARMTVKPAPPVRLPTWTMNVLMGIVTIGLISATRSPHPLYGYIELALFTSLGLTALFVRAAVSADPSDELRRGLLIVLALGGAFLGFRLFFELVAALLTQNPRGLLWSWLPFLQQRYFAKAAGWSLPLIWLLPQLMPSRRKPLLIISAIASIMIAAQLIGTGSRGALLGLVLSIVVAAALFRRPGRAYASWMLASLVIGFLLWQAIEIWLGHSTSGRIASTSISGRGPVYAALLADLRSAPWLGIGPMQFAALGRHPDLNIAGPHSMPLQIAAEWGLPVLILIVALAAYWGLRYAAQIRTGAGDDRTSISHVGIDVALFAALLLSAVHSLVANVINEPISQMVAALLIGLAWPVRLAAQPAPRRASSVISAALMIGCLLALVMVLRLGYPCVRWSAEVVQVPAPDGLVYPRLWSQGLIPYSKTCQISDQRTDSTTERP